MNIEEEYIRLIFGLKLKQLRTDKNLSLFGLSKLSGLSKSYLNEIEKGKKYPKTPKIAILSNVLEVDYDNLVSLKLDKNLAPLGEILQSKILKEIPLDLFGVKESDLIDIIANAPAKVSAFITTLIEIAQNYNLSKENFYLAALRSYQEAHNNYFEDLEMKSEQFAKSYQIDNTKKVKSAELEEILTEEFGYTIDNETLPNHEEIKELRSIYIPHKKTLLLNKNIDESQRAFIFAKEIGYNYLELNERLYTFPWVNFDSFDQVLNNFFASYFAGALLISRTELNSKLKTFFKKTKWSSEQFNKMIFKLTDSPETFYQRLTNILPKHFNFKNLFFLRFKSKINTHHYALTKELHINQQQAPHANESDEHYCRRWVSIDALKKVNQQPTKSFISEAQISHYPDTQQEYLVFSSAASDPFKYNYNRSISVGILLSTTIKNKIQFLQDPDLNKKQVGVTCERCSIKDCNSRASEATVVEKRKKHDIISNKVDEIINNYN
ncbi:MAG: helix-turn-helix domain-containing protein [Flavobacteriaceae bacterium]|nr:helix-turn-helix domain-containing protein [Flavobacteriaceae bacterium]